MDRRVETGGREAVYRLVYKLDGTESVNQMGPIVSKTTASWDGATLVLSSTLWVDGKMLGSSRELYRIENGLLIVESTRETPAGRSTGRYVHKKSSDRPSGRLAAATTFVVAALAGIPSARRAAAVEPIVTMRAE